jgi:hypothetical protein
MSGGASALGNTPVTVSGSGTLGGSGVIGGPVINAAGGTISPGFSIGTLTINNDLTLSAGSSCRFEVNLGTSANDKVVGVGTLTYGGTLVIVNVGTAPFTNGTAIKLFDAASYVAGSVSIQPSSPGNGLMWDTSTLATDGTLRVTAPPAITGVARLPDGSVSLTLTGNVGQAYTIRGSTNVATPLSTWTVLQSGTVTVSPFFFNDSTATNLLHRFYATSTP